MRCPEFENRLQRLLDQRLDPEADELLSAHAEVCPPCGRSLQLWQAISGRLEPARRESPARSGRRGAAWVGAAVAASLLALVFTYLPPAEPPTPSAPLAATVPAPSINPLTGLEQPAVPQNVLDDQAVTAAWEAGRASTPLDLDFDHFRQRLREPDWWSGLASSAWEPVDPLAEGLRPLAQSVTAALGLLVPVATSPANEPSAAAEAAPVAAASA